MESVPLLVHEVLQEFHDIFEEPTQVPPSKFHDYHIHLKEGATPITIRPYRYPQVKKEEIE